MPAAGGRWGWHQLDSRWARRLVDMAGVAPGDVVLDIGAGFGVITAALLERGARVVAFELHAGRAADLRCRFHGHAVKVVQADASVLRLPRQPFKVVANPPWSITTSVLRTLTKPQSNLQSAALVLPRWAVMRWATGHGVEGLTSKRAFDYALGPRVPARAFTPPPPSAAAVLLVHRVPTFFVHSSRQRRDQ